MVGSSRYYHLFYLLLGGIHQAAESVEANGCPKEWTKVVRSHLISPLSKSLFEHAEKAVFEIDLNGWPVMAPSDRSTNASGGRCHPMPPMFLSETWV